MTRVPVSAAGAVAVGPYSHAIASGGFVFLSGQTPLDPASGRLVEGDIGRQTRQCLANLGAVLGAAGLGFDNVVECHVFLVDMADFGAMNAEYAEHFSAPYPARTTIGVAALPLGARVEIRMVARIPDPPAAGRS
jgi:2-iminobutanoate/2-iminopropanoate deaminase